MDYTPKIPKKDLVHGQYYRGRCRNATEARWDEKLQMFIHWRNKFGTTFLEGIKHPEDELRYDVFVVEAVLINPTRNIPLNEDQQKFITV